MPAARITITLPDALLERLDRTESNRSRFIAEAVERELDRRRREALRRSLDAPHAETSATAAAGLETYRAALDDEGVPLVDASAGFDVAWREGAGWHEVSDG
jgi:predicted transcriptional regulator